VHTTQFLFEPRKKKSEIFRDISKIEYGEDDNRNLTLNKIVNDLIAICELKEKSKALKRSNL